MNSKHFPGYSKEILKKKIEGKELTEEEIKIIVKDILNNKLGDAEIAYFISGQKFRGMTVDEIYFLTKAMIDTGKTMTFGKKVISDKHCIGGVPGNRTTPLVVPICISEGLTIPKTSSKAITSPAGTADVIATIATIEVSVKRLKEIVKTKGGCMVWNSEAKISPADNKIIQIEKILQLDISSQLVASVLSKKISAGSKNILIDIPYGKGSKVENIRQAKKLKRLFLVIGKRFGVNLKVLLTDGRRPLGNGIGPVLEMLDILKVLKGEKGFPKDLAKKSIFLSAELLKLNGVKHPKLKARKSLKSGMAYKTFKGIVNAQNKNRDFDKKIAKLKPGKFSKEIVAGISGRIVDMDNKKLSYLCRILGCPENMGSGVYLHRKKGFLRRGTKLITLYSDDKKQLSQGLDYFWESGVIRLS